MLCKREASEIDRTPARSIFHVYVCINIGLGGRGGSSLNLIQALESIVILETHECTSSVSTWYRKTVYDLRFWHDDAWRESRASLVEEWNFMLDIRLGCASICKRVVGHIHWDFFFWRRNISFRFGQFVSLWQRSFLVSISGRPLLLFH